MLREEGRKAKDYCPLDHRYRDKRAEGQYLEQIKKDERQGV